MTPSRPGFFARFRGKLSFLAAAVLLVAAGIFALVCRSQSVVTLGGEAVRFGFTNDIKWDEATRRITRTGGDPYAWIEVPGAALPIRRVTIEYGGTVEPVEGHFYIFRSTSNPPHLGLTMVDGRVTPLPGGLRVEAELSDSNCLRLDLPDFLLRPLELRRIVIETPFASPWRWSFLAMAACGAGALVVLLWAWLRRRWWGEWALVALLIALKAWLATDLGLTIYGSAMHDDALFATQARSIMDGRWLGDYGEVTLSKGPVYPLFLAAVGVSGQPLQQVQAWFHAAACLLFIVALRPLVPRAGWRVSLFALLLLDPQMLSAAAIGRVLRTGIQPALVLAALGGVIGLAARVRRGPATLAGWGLLAGTAWAAFWYCREEGVWLVPSAVLILGVAAVGVWRNRAERRWWRVALLASPLLPVLLADVALRLVNRHFYGAPVTVEYTSGSFPSAYGALARIEPKEYNRLVQIPREIRMHAYAVSPAFAELQPWLEGEYGAGWLKYGWEGSTVPESQRDIRAGWTSWALRGAAARCGYYRDAATADRYWRRVAAEINAACDQGRVPAGGRRSGFVPRWHASLAQPLGEALLRALDLLVSTRDARVWMVPSQGTPEEYAVFASVTHQQPAGAGDVRTGRSVAREVVFCVNTLVGRGWTALAALAALVVCARAAWRRERALQVSVLVALVGGVAALMLVVALVEVTSFESVVSSYLAPAAPLLLAFRVLAPCWALVGFSRDGQPAAENAAS